MHKNRSSLVWAVKIALGLTALPPLVSHATEPPGDFTIISQNRSISVAADAVDVVNDDHTSKTFDAPNADVFNETIGTSASSGDGDLGSQAQASAEQDSTVSPTALSASGKIYADSYFGTGVGADSSAQSVFNTTFSVADPIEVTLLSHVIYTLDIADPQSFVATVTLDNSQGQAIAGPLDLTSFNTMGETLSLVPGTYDLAFNAQVISDDESANELDYNLSLQNSVSAVPVPRAWVSGGTLLLFMAAAALLRRPRHGQHHPLGGGFVLPA